ncbi:MAG: deoxyribose-phosphate aldolase [Phycisphaeraceae bacterium]|nr:deoxyribose-phosphate aldolase [Phycisphaeraceae bacterium]
MNLAGRIDHTILKAEATRSEVHKLVAEATEHGFASCCINGIFAADVAKELRGSGVKTCVVVGFPLGANKATIKAIEATSAAKEGAEEIDFVAHLPYLLKKDIIAAKAEFMEIVRATRTVNPKIIIKVILETAALMHGVDVVEGEARIAAGCTAARESGCDFVKTSTGFHSAGGATTEAVKLLKKHSGGLYVKASGGIRTFDDAKKMIDAGADRLGCSASVAIIQGSKPTTGAGY